jgi:hypothetical protein
MSEDTQKRIPGPVVVLTSLLLVAGLGYLIYVMVVAGRP